MCRDSSACRTYVMWSELGHTIFIHASHFRRTNSHWKLHGHKNVLKWNLALGFIYSILSMALLYEAPFKTKCHQCFRNLYLMSNTYIRRPISISDFQYIYRTSNIYIGLPIYISYVQYLYRTFDIYIRWPISIYNVRYPCPSPSPSPSPCPSQSQVLYIGCWI